MARTGPKPDVQRIDRIPDAPPGIALPSDEDLRRLFDARPEDIEYDEPDAGETAEALHDGPHPEAAQAASVDESKKLYIGRMFEPAEFAAWYAAQRLGALPFNAVGIHHTYKPNEQDFNGVGTINGVFSYYANTLGWPWGRGPHFWLYAGDGRYGTRPLIGVGTHPAHDGIGIAYRNHRYAHIEAFGYYDTRAMPKSMIDLYRFTLSVICGKRIPLKNIGAGWDGPSAPAGQVFHRNAPAAGKSCPGWQVKESWFFSAMGNPEKPEPPPKPIERKRHTLCYSPGTKWQERQAAWLLEDVPDDLMGAATKPAEIRYITQKAYDNPTVGEVVAWCLGTKTLSALSGDAQDVLGKYTFDVSDNWDARATAKVAECVVELESRFPERLKGLARRWSAHFGVRLPEAGVVTVDQISRVYRTMPRSYYETKAPGLAKAMRDGKIDTPRRISYFLANVGHESGGLKYVEELASGAQYEGRRDLGNVYPGDGARFKGRGYLQLTGRSNYAAFSKAMGVDFLANPERVKEPYHAAMSAVWFWNSRDLSASADAGDWRNVCYRINGRWPANGQADRNAYLERAQEVFGK